MPGNMLTDSIKNDLKMFISFLINTDMYSIFQGSNPISDVWSKEALRICSQHMVSSINDTNNFESRKQMCAASAFAGKFLGLNTTYMYDLILHLYPVKSNILRQKSWPYLYGTCLLCICTRVRGDYRSKLNQNLHILAIDLIIINYIMNIIKY